MADYRRIKAAASSLALAIVLAISASNAAGADDVDRLIVELDKPEWQERLASSTWVAQYNNTKGFEALTSLISNNGIPWVIRIRAIRLLGATGQTGGIPLLTDMLNNSRINYDCASLKFSSAQALGNFRNNPSALEALITAATLDMNTVVREAAIESIGKIGDKEALPVLIPLLSDRSFTIKRSALSAIGEIGGKEAASQIRRVSVTDKDPYIRDEALTLLKKLESGQS